MSAIGELLKVNAVHSKLFQRQKTERDKHRAQHPTGILVTGCMDDRVNFSVITETPFGLVKSHRNIGGKFNLEWPRFQEGIQAWNSFEKANGRNRLVIVTDHASKGHPTLGCKGFDYNQELAMMFSDTLRQQFDYVFEYEEGVYALNCTIETDEEALVFRDKRSDAKLDLSEMVDDLAVIGNPAEELYRELKSFYIDMPEHMLIDLLPFVVGNLAHIKKIRAQHRSREEKDHRASVVAVGTGLDWILQGAYIINPIDPGYLEAVAIALHLAQETAGKKGRKPVIVASASFQPPCGCAPTDEKKYWGRRLAEIKAKALADDLLKVVQREIPDPVSRIEHLTTVVNLDTRHAEVVKAR